MPDKLRTGCGDPGCPVCSNPKYEACLLRIADAHIKRLAKLGKLSGVSVDVGAHAGLWARSLVQSYERHVPDAGKVVIAVEPDPVAYNVILNDRCGNVSPVNAAAWSHDTELWLTGRGVKAYVGNDEDGIPVDGVLIDSIVHRAVDVLKIDVEGAEYEVLLGARDVFRKSSNLLVLVEICKGHLERFGRTPGDVRRLLKSYGYFPLREPKTGPDAVDKVFFMRGAR